MKQILIIFLLVWLAACSSRKVIFIDEQKSTQEALSRLSQDSIYHIAEWPIGGVPSKYEEFSDKGVILVVTKAYNQKLEKERHATLNQKIDEYQAANLTGKLFVYNGVEVPSGKVIKLKQLKPEDLSAVEILKLSTAKVIYQEKAQDENILINTKQVSDRTLIEKE